MTEDCDKERLHDMGNSKKRSCPACVEYVG